MKKAVDKMDKTGLIDKKTKAVELWRDTKGHVSNTCSAIGISRQTFYNWMENDKQFAENIVNAEWELHDDVRDSLIQKIADGDVSAIKYYLDRRHPDFKQQSTYGAEFKEGDKSVKIILSRGE